MSVAATHDLEGTVGLLALLADPTRLRLLCLLDGAELSVAELTRITDLPQVAGLLYPTELVFVGACPATFDWAEDLYRRLGAPGVFRRVDEVGEYR